MREFFIFLVVIVPLFLLGGVGWTQWMGAENAFAYALAAGICVFFGALALLVQEIAFRTDNSMAGSLGSILIRTLGPIAVGVFVKQNSPNLVEHRFFLAFVACFLLTLTLETILSVLLVNRWEKLRNKGNDTLGE
ncbi:MAG: hypothetical protein JKY95_02110 [Planctomycetaceae bacterium]|nr:hypothetical protein [Planctomycetaceae bacterium]